MRVSVQRSTWYGTYHDGCAFGLGFHDAQEFPLVIGSFCVHAVMTSMLKSIATDIIPRLYSELKLYDPFG